MVVLGINKLRNSFYHSSGLDQRAYVQWKCTSTLLGYRRAFPLPVCNFSNTDLHCISAARAGTNTWPHTRPSVSFGALKDERKT